MNDGAKATAACLGLVFAIACGIRGCESKADKDRKPGLIDSLVETSVSLTDTGKVAAKDGADFRTRLRSALKDASTEDLATLKDHNVIIALDQRLPEQDIGLLDRDIDATFYNDARGRVLALWDDGKAPGNWTLGQSTYSYAEAAISKLADGLRDGAALQESVFFASRYRRGKSSYVTRFKSADDFDQDTQKKNPDIINRSPLRNRGKRWENGSW